MNFTFTGKELSPEKDDVLLPLEREVLDLLHRISKDGKNVSTLDIEKWGKEFRGIKITFCLLWKNGEEKPEAFGRNTFFPF